MYIGTFPNAGHVLLAAHFFWRFAFFTVGR